MPDEKTIAKLCDFFDVDLLKGTKEFVKAHKAWDTNRHAKKVKIQPVLTEAEQQHADEVLATAEAFNKQLEERRNPKPAPVEDTTDIFALVYEVLSYEEFNQVFDEVAGKQGDPLKLIFHKVSYDTYKKIASVIKEG